MLSGTAKTSTALMFFDSVQSANESMRIKKICFSSATTPFMTQVSIEAELDKRGGQSSLTRALYCRFTHVCMYVCVSGYIFLIGKSFGPPGGKKMTIFMDDLSMPEKNGYVYMYVCMYVCMLCIG